ncbi:MAG: hypothetical protein K0R06_1934 [Clostridium sp.]|jgi:hypothetical protein|nr:hypothetical protein [Clostridium sp.]
MEFIIDAINVLILIIGTKNINNFVKKECYGMLHICLCYIIITI